VSHVRLSYFIKVLLLLLLLFQARKWKHYTKVHNKRGSTLVHEIKIVIVCPLQCIVLNRT